MPNVMIKVQNGLFQGLGKDFAKWVTMIIYCGVKLKI